jgi:biofilm PGA synthesis N-glycosyltransferase PgaC
MTFRDYLRQEPVITLVMLFLCSWPLASALLSLLGSLAHRSRPDPRRWLVPEPGDVTRAHAHYPVISVLIPAYNEAQVIGLAIAYASAIRWPALDIIVINDGSSDATAEVTRPLFITGPRVSVRLLSKANEGKSLALNDGLALCRGELALILDADGAPAPDVLELMVPHFGRFPRVCAVTGNPRVLNIRSMLTRLQAIEFSGTVGVQRRADAIWGRLTTFSGLCTLLRRDSVLAVGGFSPKMATEDIELTWRLQLAGCAVTYEPRALFGMQVPENLHGWWRQRIRWSRGLAQVLRRHLLSTLRPRNWRMWPLLFLAVASLVWVHAMLISSLLLVLSLLGVLGRSPPAIAALLAILGSVTIVGGILQGLTGIWLDRRFDPELHKQWPWTPCYPLYYWILCTASAIRGTLPGLVRRPPRLSTWNMTRSEANDSTEHAVQRRV